MATDGSRPEKFYCLKYAGEIEPIGLGKRVRAPMRRRTAQGYDVCNGKNSTANSLFKFFVHEASHSFTIFVCENLIRTTLC